MLPIPQPHRSQRQELIKASDVVHDQVLASPVDGVVQQLKVHTVDGVVSPAKLLLVVVPKDQALEVEARVLNKDIGIVRAGQAVAIKIEASPFARYGVIEGVVTSVSNDAIADEKLGLYYSARLRAKKSTIDVDSRSVLLSPGMQHMEESGREH